VAAFIFAGYEYISIFLAMSKIKSAKFKWSLRFSVARNRPFQNEKSQISIHGFKYLEEKQHRLIFKFLFSYLSGH
jgi:hypothetical protein